MWRLLAHLAEDVAKVFDVVGEVELEGHPLGGTWRGNTVLRDELADLLIEVEDALLEVVDQVVLLTDRLCLLADRLGLALVLLLESGQALLWVLKDGAR